MVVCNPKPCAQPVKTVGFPWIVADDVCAVGTIHFGQRGTWPKAGIVDGAVARDDDGVRGVRDFDYLVVELVTDQDVAISELHRPCSQRRRIAARPQDGITGDEVPVVHAVLIGFHDAVVVGIRDKRMAVGNAARKKSPSERRAGGRGVHASWHRQVFRPRPACDENNHQALEVTHTTFKW